jgi:hypothetical protein
MGRWRVGRQVYVPPQAVLDLRADIADLDLTHAANPSVYLEYQQVGADTGLLGTTIVLRRKGSTVRGELAWVAEGFRPAVLP